MRWIRHASDRNLREMFSLDSKIPLIEGTDVEPGLEFLSRQCGFLACVDFPFLSFRFRPD